MSRTHNENPEVRLARSRIAREARYGTPESVQQARAEYREMLLREDIREALAAAPPLSEQARHELAALLVPSPRAAS